MNKPIRQNYQDDASYVKALEQYIESNSITKDSAEQLFDDCKALERKVEQIKWVVQNDPYAMIGDIEHQFTLDDLSNMRAQNVELCNSIIVETDKMKKRINAFITKVIQEIT